MAAPPGRATTVKVIGALSNKGMKLTKPEHLGASRLMPGVRRTIRDFKRIEDGMVIVLACLLAATLQVTAASGDEPVRLDGRIREPRRLKHPAPDYPPEASEAGLHGRVVLECTIGPDGKVKSLFVCRSDLRAQGVGAPHDDPHAATTFGCSGLSSDMSR
jgi:hypothetical protein